MSPVRTISFLLGCTIATTLSAQEIPVRSGAHDGFARLVARIPKAAEWELNAKDNGAGLRIPGFAGAFDVSRVFDLIDRSFIASVEPADSGFDITFACNCTAEAFEVDGGFLVIDVAEAPAQNVVLVPRFDWPTPFTRLQLPGTTPEIADEMPVPQEPVAVVAPEPVGMNEPAAPSVQSLAQEVLVDALPEPENNAPGVSPTQLAEAQERLARRVAVAATRGILDPTHNTIDLPFNTQRPQIDVSIFDSSSTQLEPETPQARPGAANLRVTSSSDLPGQALTDELNSTSSGLQCPEEALIDVAAWGTDLPPMQYISSLRAQLFSETDRLQHGIAVDLARLYLNLGFGAEAYQVLSIDPRVSDQYPELVDIAEILEFEQVSNDAFLAPYTDCASPVALWAILARNEVNSSDSADTNAALRALTGLPMHLRRFVAPALSRKLLQYGDEEAAATALRSLERAPDPLTAGAELARAELQMADGERAAAQKTLAGVVASNEQQSAEALIQFVESHLAAGTPVDEDVATLVEAYAIEMRDDALGPRLRSTHVLALAKSGQFDEAFEALDRLGQRGSTEIVSDLRASLIGIVTRSADDVVFLERIFEHSQSGRQVATPADTISAVQRLSNLGFPSVAETLLNNQETLPNSARVRELRASLALELGRASEAIAMLSEVDSERANRLRAKATSRLNNFDQASAMFASIGDDAESVRSAWLAGNWDRLSKSEAGQFTEVANLVDAEVEDTGNPEGMLGRLSESLSESAQARELIQELLRAPSN